MPFIIGVFFWFIISIGANGLEILIPDNLYSIALDFCIIVIFISPIVFFKLMKKDEDKDDEDNERG